MLSLCVKALERWIVEGLYISERMPEPRRVSVTRKRQLKNGTVAKLFPEATRWNREKDFQLKYEDMNMMLDKKSTRRITSFHRKGMDIFEEF
jgi:hypothetical protein